jgi:hypothetical protein
MSETKQFPEHRFSVITWYWGHTTERECVHVHEEFFTSLKAADEWWFKWRESKHSVYLCMTRVGDDEVIMEWNS